MSMTVCIMVRPWRSWCQEDTQTEEELMDQDKERILTNLSADWPRFFSGQRNQQLATYVGAPHLRALEMYLRGDENTSAMHVAMAGAALYKTTANEAFDVEIALRDFEDGIQCIPFWYPKLFEPWRLWNALDRYWRRNQRSFSKKMLIPYFGDPSAPPYETFVPVEHRNSVMIAFIAAFTECGIVCSQTDLGSMEQLITRAVAQERACFKLAI